MSEEIWTTINGHLLDCAKVRGWDLIDGPAGECDCRADEDDDFWEPEVGDE